MEMSLLEPRTAVSSPFSSFKHQVERFSRCSSCKGRFFRASYSRVPNKASCSGGVSSISQEKLAAEAFTHKINGTNGLNSKLFSRDSRLLDADDDQYDGIVIDPNGLPSNPIVFSSNLRFSLSHWKKKGKKGVWLKLLVEQSELVPIAIKAGFQYHHAEPGYLMLTYWIPDGPCMLPANASHHVGVGGFVINDKNEVLVVQEKYCSPQFANFWKIPTGFIVEKEEIYTGVAREVKEETGIDTEFVEVIAFRHAHNIAFEKSDLFFVCMLRPLSTQIIVDDFEIQAAKWMPLAEFVEQSHVKEDVMFKKIIDICIARLDKYYCGLNVHQLVSKFDGKLSSLYYNIVDGEDLNCAGKLKGTQPVHSLI
ncbi:Nudix hydrolase 8, partial [Cucurbita argyrosperma subsp. sororia]